MYMQYTSAKDLWEALEKKYVVSDAGQELYLVEKYNDFCMVDECTVVEQGHELQLIVSEFGQFGCAISERF